MTSARDVFQQSCCAAIARYEEVIGDGVPRRIAHPVLLDQLVKAWEKSQVAAARAAYGQRGVPAPPRPSPAARTKASADAARAARRAKISPQAAAARIRDEAGQWAAL